MSTFGSEPSPEVRNSYGVGTLRYTKAGLFVLFGWLLWGDFCFTVMERVLPAIYPVYLMDKLGASNKITNILMVTIPQFMIVFLCPAISFRSDRTRTRWGRRIPYMTYTAPFLCLFLVGLGYSEQISAFLQLSRFPEWLYIRPYAATIALLGFLIISFNFFNDFVASVYWYLFADVVPKAFLGRFLGLFRMVGILAEWFFQEYIFPYAGTHMHWIFLGAAVLYGVGFGMMCWRVKEGQYPPVENPEADSSIVAQVKMYFRDCFTHPVYVLLFLHSAGMALVGAGMLANTVFLLAVPGLTYDNIGHVKGQVALLTMCLTYLGGWMSDRYHALRTSLLTLAVLVPVQFACFYWLVDYPSFVWLTWVGTIPYVLFQAAVIPLYISLFPPEKYGQFSSANAMFRSAMAVLGGLASGWFLDYMSNNGQMKDALRWMYIWSGFWHIIGLICLVGVYFYWKRGGGDLGYTPPGSIAERERLAGAGAVEGTEASVPVR